MTQDSNKAGINKEPEEKPSSTDDIISPIQKGDVETHEVYDYDNTIIDKREEQEISSLAQTLPQDLSSSIFTALNSDNGYSLSHNNDRDRATETGFIGRVKSYFRPKNDPSLRETIEEYIERENNNEKKDTLLSNHEKVLLSNVLELHTICAKDVMVPRADIIGVPDDITQKELFALFSEKQYSRYPVYKNTLDNIVGSIHIKDILISIARGEKFDMDNLIRDIPIISPSMHTLDLLTQMRMTRKHLVLVVDEFGGIDGLVTISDMIEAIVGEIDDEHNLEIQPEISLQTDGTLIADARYYIDEFEEIYGEILSEEERDENDTLGGLMFDLAGRVPARGEVLKHSSGMVFEIVDADPRRVKRLRIRNIPQPRSCPLSKLKINN
ncbi:MAG: HlyC/CorC family transporter [Alphaproteobacteria bacterium]|nr:HlyC/CorC family transporter [Alphaproteobacteria bacterium]